jgi:hypothetical protein
MFLSRVKPVLLTCAIFCAGCDYPPEEAANIREQLQAQIARGQVYVTHSANELSFMIKNSELTMRPEAEKEKLVGIVEKEAVEFLSRHRNYKYIRIYFLGEGTSGIDKPYICQTTYNACLQIRQQ